MCQNCANNRMIAAGECLVCRVVHPTAGACRDCGVMETCGEDQGRQMWRCGECAKWVCGDCAKKCSAADCEKALCSECRVECACGFHGCDAVMCRDTERCMMCCDVCHRSIVNDVEHFHTCEAAGCFNMVCVNCIRDCYDCGCPVICDECNTCEDCEGADSDSEQAVRQSGVACQG
jgi:hypothetical protein